MQALQQKKAEEVKLKEQLASIVVRNIEERVEHNKKLQYEEHQDLFVVNYSTVHKAACDNDLLGVKTLLNNPKLKFHVDDFDKNGECAIHVAAEKGGTDVVEFLVKAGCRVNLSTTHNTTSLMLACKNNRAQTVESLFALGAKIGLQNKSGLTALHFAAQGDHVESIELLVRLQTETNAKLQLQQEEEKNDAKAGMDKGPKEKKDKKKDKKAKEQDKPEYCQVLDVLNQGANNKRTPLHTACEWDSINTIQFLIDQGVSLTAQDTNGDTALHKTARRYSFSTYRLLSKAGASEKTKNMHGESAHDLLHDNCKV